MFGRNDIDRDSLCSTFSLVSMLQGVLCTWVWEEGNLSKLLVFKMFIRLNLTRRSMHLCLGRAKFLVQSVHDLQTLLGCALANLRFSTVCNVFICFPHASREIVLQGIKVLRHNSRNRFGMIDRAAGVADWFPKSSVLTCFVNFWKRVSTTSIHAP